jgi:hypothetical protein
VAIPPFSETQENPMPDHEDYKVVSARGNHPQEALEVLEQRVREALTQGWKVAGGVSITPGVAPDYNSWAAQALTR